MADEHRTLIVHTTQLGAWRKARKLGLSLFDTTVRSGHRFVAPTWDMVLGHKSGELSDQDYTTQYQAILEYSLRVHEDQWNDLLCSGEVVLACYCKPDKFCHRHLLKEFIHKLCDERQMIFVDKGEIR